MANYIKPEDQEEMIRLMLKYLELTNNCEKEPDTKANIIMNKFFGYVDEIINGVIYMPKYKFYRYAEVDDLIQQGRLSIILSISKQQWDKDRGGIFNFFTTVIIRNLINYTSKNNKYPETTVDITSLFNHNDLTYEQDFNQKFLIQDIFQSLKNFFKGKKKFEKLTELLEHYYYSTRGKKFIKKHFIEFAKAYNFSPAITNTFFAFCHRSLHQNKELQDLLNNENE